MTLAERLDAILEELPADWREAHLVLTVDPEQADRAAVILAALSPGRVGSTFHLRIARAGSGGPSPGWTRRVLSRLEEEGIDARLSVPEHGVLEVASAEAQAESYSPLAEAWDALVRELQEDWSDLYLHVELASSDDLERAALLLGPVNPYLFDGPRPALRFRVARRVGYGAAPEMARRVLERLDDDGIRGRLRLLRVHEDVNPGHTQGLVWREAGRAI